MVYNGFDDYKTRASLCVITLAVIQYHDVIYTKKKNIGLIVRFGGIIF